jgi:hypothetical protein
MDILEGVIHKTNLLAIIISKSYSEGGVLKITNFVTVIIQGIGGKPIVFTDTRKENEMDTFTREFGSLFIKIKNGIQVLLEQPISCTFINKIKREEKNPVLKIITMDVETRENDGKMELVCISFCIDQDGEKTILKTFAI